jgi:3-hydroxyacyl-CoA dehydrogenase/enoyl-CoA hydratase/3-hydroxybutyryl-CoA epimerase
LLTYLNEAAYLLQDGYDIEKIDREIEKFGMPMGPFILADVVGIDVGVKVAESLERGYGARMRVADILQEIHKNHPNLLGKKSLIGFYRYDKSGAAIGQNPEIYQILSNISEIVKQSQALENQGKNSDISYPKNNEIIERCILTMINESAKCLEENVVKNARYLDLAMIMGTGFPAFRGGVLRYADKIGIDNVVKKLQIFEKKFGARFMPSQILLEMAQNNQKFYS